MRSALRWTGAALGFATMVPIHVVARSLGAPDLMPPVFLGMMGRIAGLRVKVEGTPREGALLLPNHVSWLDILALAGACRATFVAHSGLTVHGGLKWLCDQNHTIFITRDQRGSVASQVEQVRAALGRRRVAIFAEATTNDGNRLLPFRSSLLSAVEPLADMVPIQPVALDYEDAGEIAWFGAEPGMTNVRRILRRRSGVRLTIRFLEPLAGDELTDRKAMARAAEAAVARALRL